STVGFDFAFFAVAVTIPLPLPRESDRSMVPLKASGLVSFSMAGNSNPVVASPAGASAVTGDPVPASAIWRVTPESAIAGDAADAPMSETTNAMAARYAMNRGFKSLPSYVMRPRRRGIRCRTPSRPPSPRALVRVTKAGEVVKRRGDLPIGRATDGKAVRR